MTCTLHVAWDDRLAGYDFGPGHPMAPLRLKLTMELARAFGLDRLGGVTVDVPPAATGVELELFHDPGYIGMVRLAGHQASEGGLSHELTTRALLMHGLGTEDDPLFPGMHEAAAMVTGATLAAARAVWTSAAQHGPARCARRDPRAGPRGQRRPLAAHRRRRLRARSRRAEDLDPPAVRGRWRAARPGRGHPELWREYVSWTTSQTAPERMTDGAPGTFTHYESGHDPADPVDRAIMATRKTVFPQHGLMP